MTIGIRLEGSRRSEGSAVYQGFLQGREH